MPKLSIIIPAFNASKTIARCLKSIRSQTLTDFEVLIQDGGSTDDTIEKVDRFRSQNSGIQIFVESKKDGGIYDAMNLGAARARGGWLFFLGSDDELNDEHVFEKVMSSEHTNSHNVLYGNVQIIGECIWANDGSIYDGPFDLAKLLNRNICHQAIFYRTEFARKVGAYNTAYAICADWDFNMRCWAQSPFKYVNVTVSKFYAGGQSSHSGQDERFGKDFLPNLFRYFNFSLFDPLINAPDFSRFPEVVKMQKSKGHLYSLTGKVVRIFMKLRTK
jgi:glycosyltransferase involved in cell wall biosynthesis